MWPLRRTSNQQKSRLDHIVLGTIIFYERTPHIYFASNFKKTMWQQRRWTMQPHPANICKKVPTTVYYVICTCNLVHYTSLRVTMEKYCRWGVLAWLKKWKTWSHIHLVCLGTEYPPKTKKKSRQQQQLVFFTLLLAQLWEKNKPLVCEFSHSFCHAIKLHSALAQHGLFRSATKQTTKTEHCLLFLSRDHATSFAIVK